MAGGEGDGVGRGGDGQHEGVGAADRGRDHEVERVDGHSDGLTETKTHTSVQMTAWKTRSPPGKRSQSTGQKLLTTVVNVN